MERKADLQTVNAFWGLMSQHFPELYVDLSLFNTLFNNAEDSQLFKEAVREKVLIGQAYEKT
jgi:putative SOS response-associated peptidase YedK